MTVATPAVYTNTSRRCRCTDVMLHARTVCHCFSMKNGCDSISDQTQQWFEKMNCLKSDCSSSFETKIELTREDLLLFYLITLARIRSEILWAIYFFGDFQLQSPFLNGCSFLLQYWPFGVQLTHGRTPNSKWWKRKRGKSDRKWNQQKEERAEGGDEEKSLQFHFIFLNKINLV